MSTVQRNLPLIERYREYLPVTDATPVISMGEGSTPLVPLPKLSACLELDIHVKLEGLNPTGSFKDRGMTMAISKAAEEGATAVICASTGNTSAAAAAYAARAGLTCAVIIPGGKIALGKLAQALIYGAKVLAVDGNFDDALRIVREMSEKHPIALVNSLNPFRLEGQKTGAFEVIEALGDAPDVLCIPVGNAGNISAYWMGFQQFHELGKAVRILATQPGDRARDVIRLFSYEPDDMAKAVEAQTRTAVRAKKLTKAQAQAIVAEYKEALDAYTYLDFSQ